MLNCTRIHAGVTNPNDSVIVCTVPRCSACGRDLWRGLDSDGEAQLSFVSLTGLISDIAWQVAKEGNEVRYFIGDKKERDIADGFVPKSKDWEKDIDWADIIIFDDTLGQGEKAANAARGGEESDWRHGVLGSSWKTIARSARKN